MFPFPLAWTLKVGLSSKAGIPELWDTSVPVINGMYNRHSLFPLTPPWARRDSISRSGHYIGPYYFAVKLDRLGQGLRLRPRLRSRDFRGLGLVYSITLHTEIADQSVIHGMFLLSPLWARVLFDSDASHSFVTAL